MKGTCWIAVGASLLFAGLSAGEELRAADAVRRAGERARCDARLQLAMAQAQEKLLEEQSKFRVDLRPRLALFTFSNPALLASSLGASLLMGRNAPPPWVIAQARLDRLKVEIATEGAVAAAERKAMRAYFDLAAAHETYQALASHLNEREKTKVRFAQRVRQSRATVGDASILESELISLRLRLEQAGYERSKAALTLAEAAGLSDEATSLAVLELPPDAEVVSAAQAESIYRMALRRRPVMQDLTGRLSAEKNRMFLDRRLGGANLMLMYSNIQDGAGQKLGLSSGGFLLGGHSGTLDLGVRISLRKTKETEAAAAILAAKIAALEYEVSRLEEEARRELSSLRLLALFSTKKAELMAQKLRIAEEALPVAQRRERAGLVSEEAVEAVESEVTQLRTEYRRAKDEGRVHFAHLLAAAGLDWKEAKVQLREVQSDEQ